MACRTGGQRWSVAAISSTTSATCAQLPAGYRIAPHWHPTTENVTVLAGTVALGMGEKYDELGLTNLEVGGFAALPADMRHFFVARTAATIQVHGMGPFAITYVNAADDPRNKK